MAEVLGEKKEERVNPYRLNLVPYKEGRRPEWNLILISDVPVTVDFFHTDMMEKCVSIMGVKKETEEEDGIVK